jgi:hypothetical protein
MDFRPAGLDDPGCYPFSVVEQLFSLPHLPAMTGKFRSIPGYKRRINDDRISTWHRHRGGDR